MEAPNVKKVLVVGAGVMGHGIAQVYAQAGLETNLVDLNEKILNRAMNLIRSNLETLAEFGRVQAAEIPAVLDRIHPSTDLAAGAQDVDLAVETVNEVAEVKKKVFADLERVCPPDTVLSSNTSSLDIFNIAELERPERLVAAHWFAPPHIVPLVEVCPGPKTTPEALNLVVGLLKKAGKQVVVLKRFFPAYIVNRIQFAIMRTVFEIIENGWAEPAMVDLAVKASLGVRLPIVGVMQSCDFNGLDIVKNSLGKNPPKFLTELVEKGHLGVKTSKGIFDYSGRSEPEILKKRDQKYLKVLANLEELKAFESL